MSLWSSNGLLYILVVDMFWGRGGFMLTKLSAEFSQDIQPGYIQLSSM